MHAASVCGCGMNITFNFYSQIKLIKLKIFNMKELNLTVESDSKIHNKCITYLLNKTTRLHDSDFSQCSV